MKAHKILYRISIATLVLVASTALYFLYSIIVADFRLNTPLSSERSEVARTENQMLHFDYCTNVKATVNYQLIDGQIIDLAQETTVSGCDKKDKSVLIPPTINKGKYKLRVIASYQILFIKYEKSYDTSYFNVK